MALNFPLNPSDGDTYEGYVYDATAGVWNANQGQIVSRFSTSATQPNSPTAGDGWLNPANGKTYVYYDGYWIESGNPVIGGVEPYDKETLSTGYFALPKGTTAQRPDTPQNGDIRFNTTLGEPEWYSETTGSWVFFRNSVDFDVEYLTVAGGGGGGANWGGGGGAGGHRDGSLKIISNIEYSISIGGGGSDNSDGSDSIFASINSAGGGAGGGGDNGSPGGSGGGGSGNEQGLTFVGGSGNTPTTSPAQGNDGGTATSNYNLGGAGGGGASSAGSNGGTNGGNGGSGSSNSITGSSVTRAGGGGGNQYFGNWGTGGSGGGGRGGSNGTAAVDGSNNTGSGGGGGGNSGAGHGGSGIIILKYPSDRTLETGAGLTSSTSTSGNYKITTFTAGTDTVTFS